MLDVANFAMHGRAANQGEQPGPMMLTMLTTSTRSLIHGWRPLQLPSAPELVFLVRSVL